MNSEAAMKISLHLGMLAMRQRESKMPRPIRHPVCKLLSDIMVCIPPRRQLFVYIPLCIQAVSSFLVLRRQIS